jgi:dienelactone hydrolase
MPAAALSSQAPYELDFTWVHLTHSGSGRFVETYGYTGTQGVVNLEGILIRPKGRSSRTLHIYMHPATTLQLLPVTQQTAREGTHVLCAGSRYARNDTAAVLEQVLIDLGVYIRHAKEHWGYDKIVLAGWSGGGSLALFYQSQAERPDVVRTPAGDPIDLAGARLIPADAVIFQAAAISRASLLLNMIDPSVRNEHDPDDIDSLLDLYSPHKTSQPPYTRDFLLMYRAAQLDRMRRITSWVKETLNELASRGTAEVERPFVVYRTLADPRFLDPGVDPNDRPPRWCYLGDPLSANTGPAGLARFSTLRSWLSQWSIDDSRSDATVCAARISVPLLVIENSADDAVPQPHPAAVYAAATTRDKAFQVMRGANHYYAGQADLLHQATSTIRGWLAERDIGVD